MRKSDKKTESEIIRRLTEVCEAAKADCAGFVWLTHEVNYDRFPESLKVTLVFGKDTPEETILTEFRDLIPKVQQALKPVLGMQIPPRQIEARKELSD